MELGSSISDYSSFMESHNGPSIVGNNSDIDTNNAFHEPCKNLSLSKDKEDDKEENEENVEEDEFGDDEVFGPEKESSIRSMRRRPGRPAKIRTTSEPVSKRGTKYPCGVCGEGVGTGGVLCGACGQWVHNSKYRSCTGLDRKNNINGDKFKCPSCIGNNREINLVLRNRALSFSKGKAKNCKSKKGEVVTTGKKRVLPDPSPEKKCYGNPINTQKAEGYYVG